MDFATQQKLIERERKVFRRRLSSFTDPAWPPDIRLIVQHIHKHLFAPDLSVGRVRQILGLRSNSYSLHFERHCRMTMRRYIENKRMLAAMRLLTFDRLKVGFIALGVGYSSPRTFGRAFRRCLDFTPTAFRVKAKERSYVPYCFEPSTFVRLVRERRTWRGTSFGKAAPRFVL